MKLLLDESVPRQLARFLPGSFEVRTVQQMGWAGCANGELLRRAADCEFHALVTVDQRMEYQQNLRNLPLPVIVLVARRIRVQELRPLLPSVVEIARGGLRRGIYRIGNEPRSP